LYMKHACALTIRGGGGNNCKNKNSSKERQRKWTLILPCAVLLVVFASKCRINFASSDDTYIAFALVHSANLEKVALPSDFEQDQDPRERKRGLRAAEDGGLEVPGNIQERNDSCSCRILTIARASK
jgi:hypothetical protein